MGQAEQPRGKLCVRLGCMGGDAGCSCSTTGLTAVRAGTGCVSDMGTVGKPIKAYLKY